VLNTSFIPETQETTVGDNGVLPLHRQALAIFDRTLRTFNIPLSAVSRMRPAP
jgi:hypothetical protein